MTLGLGVTHLYDGNLLAAEVQLKEAQVHYKELGDRYGLAVATVHCGHIARESGDIAGAMALYGDALRAFKSVGALETTVECIEWLAICATDVGSPELALRLFGATASARETLRLPPPGENDAQLVAQGLDRASKRAASAASFTLAAGRTLTLEQASDEALEFAGSMKHNATVTTEASQSQG